jgi:hypothetical protein
MKKIDWLSVALVLLFTHIGVLTVMLVATFIEAITS